MCFALTWSFCSSLHPSLLLSAHTFCSLVLSCTLGSLPKYPRSLLGHIRCGLPLCLLEGKKTTQEVKVTTHINKGKWSTLVPSTVKLLHREKERENQWGSRRLQAWPETGSWWELIIVGSTGKGTSGMDKFSSKVHRVHMELGGKLLTSLRIETQFLERLQSVSVVDGAVHTQKDDVKSNRGSLENVANFEGLCAVPLQRSAGSEVWCPHSILFWQGGCHAEVCWGLKVGAVWG